MPNMHTAKNRTNLYTFQTCIIGQLILVDNLKTSATIEVKQVHSSWYEVKLPCIGKKQNKK